MYSLISFFDSSSRNALAILGLKVSESEIQTENHRLEIRTAWVVCH